MNRSQKRFAVKTFLATLLLVTSLLFSDEISAMVGEHKKAFMWLVLGFVTIVVAFSNNKSAATHIPSYAERHFEFNRLLDENPWMKIYYAVYGMAVVMGVYYAMSNGIEIGSFGLLGTLFLVILPIITLMMKQAYMKAGKEHE